MLTEMKIKQFKLFQCCIPVKGIKNGIIIDFQRKIIHKVSNQIIDIIKEYSKKNIYDLFNDFNETKKILKSHIRYFIENELVILSNSVDSYPSLSEDFFIPVVLDSIGIEIESLSVSMENFLKFRIDELGVNSIKLIFKNQNIEQFIRILSLLETSKVKAIVLYLEFSTTMLLELNSYVKENPRIAKLIFYNFDGQINKSDFDEKFRFEKLSVNDIFYNKTIVSMNDFVLDIDVYLEALKYNLMFNKTLFIDSFGNIKIHKEDSVFYGNIKNDEIREIINNDAFNLFWNISKDQIEVCKDCEFRYICPDGRIPYKTNSKDLNYKFKTICNYDPYEGKWNS